MTDRELLELAAKAAGYDFAWYCRGANNPNGIPNVPFANGHEWNPLTDDGDALRLAVKLQLYTHTGFGTHIYDDQDPYKATRRAIVRAAAEIGKAKELAPKPQGWNHISVEPDDL